MEPLKRWFPVVKQKTAKVIESMSNRFNKKELLHIATIGKTVGLNGDMKFHIKSDFPEQFVKGASFWTQKGERLTLAFVNDEGDKIRIEGVSTPEAAKKFTNVKLFTTYDETRDTIHLDEGEYFWFDIIGCEVYEKRELLGKIVEIERLGLDDYLSIKTAEHLVEQGLSKQFLVPYIDRYLVATDVAEKRIELRDAKDLLEAS